MKRSKTLAIVLEELAIVSSEVGKGLLSIVSPPKSNKPKWCQCNKCGGWHYQAK